MRNGVLVLGVLAELTVSAGRAGAATTNSFGEYFFPRSPTSGDPMEPEATGYGPSHAYECIYGPPGFNRNYPTGKEWRVFYLRDPAPYAANKSGTVYRQGITYTGSAEDLTSLQYLGLTSSGAHRYRYDVWNANGSLRASCNELVANGAPHFGILQFRGCSTNLEMDCTLKPTTVDGTTDLLSFAIPPYGGAQAPWGDKPLGAWTVPPHAQNVQANQASIVFDFSGYCPTTLLRYATNPLLKGYTEVAPWVSGYCTDGQCHYQAKTTITGLAANTTYYYQVIHPNGCSDTPSPSQRVVSEIGRFQTSGQTAFSFVVYGDARGQNDDPNDFQTHRRIADSAAAFAPKFIIGTGDYGIDGTDGDDLWRFFWRVTPELFRRTTMLFTYGNHEFSGGSGIGNTLWDTFVVPLGTPANPAPDFSYYSYTWGNVHVAMINTEKSIAAGSPQYAWLEHDLRTARATAGIDWIFVASHNPPLSVYGGHSEDSTYRETMKALFNRADICVNGWFAGHNHNLQFLFYDNGMGLHNLPGWVIGGGGAPLTNGYHSSQGLLSWWTKNYGFATVDISGGQSWTLKMRDQYGAQYPTASWTFAPRVCGP